MHIEREHVAEPAKIPPPLYAAGLAKHYFERSSVRLGDVESRVLRRRLRGCAVDKPIYVTGMARAGTTITLEMLSQHPDVATHRYRDMAQPYLPYAWNWLLGMELAARAPATALSPAG